MARLIQCDRCGKIINVPYFMTYELTDKEREDDKSYKRNLELCWDCIGDLNAFIRGEPILQKTKKCVGTL